MSITDTINNRRSPDLDDIESLAVRWSKYHLKKDGTALHQKMKPLIDSAINSYGAGVPGIRVQAYKLAFDALNTFDPTKGADIKTHVFNNLKRLNRISANRSNIVRVPENVSRDYAHISKAIATFSDEYGREPNDDELSDITKLSKKRIDKILNRRTFISGSESVTPEGADRVSSKGISMDNYIDYLYASSDAIDKSIIEMSSGYKGKPILKNMDIARKLNMTPAAISQRMDRLRNRMTELKSVL